MIRKKACMGTARLADRLCMTKVMQRSFILFLCFGTRSDPSVFRTTACETETRLGELVISDRMTAVAHAHILLLVAENEGVDDGSLA